MLKINVPILISIAGLCGGAGLRIKENKEVYEGEVTELTPEETEAPSGGQMQRCAPPPPPPTVFASTP